MSGYNATLSGGQEIYIPNWSAKVAFENLTQVCKALGQTEVVEISALNVPVAMGAVMGSDDHVLATQMVFHFVGQARIDGDKIDSNMMDQLGMAVIIELFTHVMHSQYNDFFVSGLAKAPSQSK